MGVTRRCILKADPAIQRRLLDVQALDLRLDQLAHRRASVKEKNEVDELARKRTELQHDLVAVETRVVDLTRAQRKAEADVEQVRTRRARDEQRLNAGQVASPRDLQNLQHEIETLKGRQSELEEVELDVMERLETATGDQTRLVEKRDELEHAHAAAAEALTKVYAEIDAEAERVGADRRAAAEGIDGPLIELYQKQRAQHGGIGAAAMRHRRCEGCRIELDATFLNEVRGAAADDVVRCEECRRILVRTPDSGL